MFRLLWQRNVALLWIGGLFSLTGAWITIAVLPFYIYEQTRSTLLSGMLWVASSLPGLLLSSLAGVFVDRWERKRTMVVTNLLRALLVLLLLFVRSPDQLWLVYTVAFLQASVALFFAPAENALLPHLVGEHDLVAANSLNALNDSLARLIGPLLGGALLALAGLAGVVLVNSGLLLTAGLMISQISNACGPTQGSEATGNAHEIPTSLAGEWRQGLRVVRQEPTVTAMFVVAATALVADSMITALLAPFIHDVLHRDAQALGLLWTLRGVGGLLGGIVVVRAARILSLPRLVALSLCMLGTQNLVVYTLASLPLLLLSALLAGVSVVCWLTSQQAMLQCHVIDRFRGRVFGLLGTTSAVALLVGSGVAGVGGEIVGIVPLLMMAGGLYLLAGVIALVVFGRLEPSLGTL